MAEAEAGDRMAGDVDPTAAAVVDMAVAMATTRANMTLPLVSSVALTAMTTLADSHRKKCPLWERTAAITSLLNAIMIRRITPGKSSSLERILDVMMFQTSPMTRRLVAIREQLSLIITAEQPQGMTTTVLHRGRLEKAARMAMLLDVGGTRRTLIDHIICDTGVSY